MKNLLFIGNFYTDAILDEVRRFSNGSIGLSNHNFEKSILYGLNDCDIEDLKCITIPIVYSYPQYYRRMTLHGDRTKIGNVAVKSIPLLNIFLLNRLWSKIAGFFEILHAVKSFDGNHVDIIVDAPKTYFFSAIQWCRLFTKKKLEVSLIIPDIPSVMTQSLGVSNPLKRYLVGRRNAKVMRQASKCDHFILLTEQMTDFFSAPIDYIVMEGLIDFSHRKADDSIQPKSGTQSFLYTGSLSKIYGILNLCEAFCQANIQNSELWICGSGDGEEDVKKYVQLNNKIKFFGLVSPMQAVEFQKKASFLVNPRTSEGEYTKYSFPSKTMEYLLANKPVIMNKLPGIPEEYFKYVYTPDNCSVEALAEKMREVSLIESEKLIERAQAGYLFVRNEKNAKVQMKRVISMFSDYKSR